jgi:hypothetical protein
MNDNDVSFVEDKEWKCKRVLGETLYSIRSRMKSSIGNEGIEDKKLGETEKENCTFSAPLHLKQL